MHALAMPGTAWSALSVEAPALLSRPSQTSVNVCTPNLWQTSLISFLFSDMIVFCFAAPHKPERGLPRDCNDRNVLLRTTSAGLTKVRSTTEPDPPFRKVFTSHSLAGALSNWTKASNKLCFLHLILCYPTQTSTR